MIFGRSKLLTLLALWLCGGALALGEQPTTAQATRPAPTPEALCAVERLQRFAAGHETTTPRKLVFVYFTPADRTPPEGYRARLTRVMSDIQDFYAREMDYHGLGRRTIAFDSTADGAMVLHDVKGQRPTADYLESGRGSGKGSIIAWESRPVLAAAGIDDNQETVVYFCDLRTQTGARITGIGPYYGGGSYRSGRAWFTDATILDSDLLGNKTTLLRDEQYGHISAGRYNSIFIGGAAHELGHALGLPHDRQRRDEALRGTSLMGSGNRTYGEERRGDGRGSMLTLADALRLASHPMFSGTPRDMNVPPQCRLENLQAHLRDGRLELTGRLAATPEAYALIAYNDPDGDSDYDATTWTAPLDATDHFTLHIGEFHPGGMELRLVVCHLNGATSRFSYRLTTGADGTPDLTLLAVRLALHDALDAWAAGRLDEARQLATQKAQAPDTTPVVRPWAQVLAAMAGPEPVWPTLAETTVAEVVLSRVRWTEARVGWGPPTRNHFPRQVGPELPFLCVGDHYYADGFYAHVPARLAFDTGGQWKTFTATIGLQAGATGSAVFVVRADGREVFRSKKVEGASAVAVTADVTGAKTLELLTEDAGAGSNMAWAVWCAPRLTR